MADINKQVVSEYQDYLIRVDNDRDIAFHGKVLAEVKGMDFNDFFGGEVFTVLTMYQSKPNEEKGSMNFVMQKCCKNMAGDDWQPENGPSSRINEHYEKNALFLADTVNCFSSESMAETFSDTKNSILLFRFFGYNHLAKDLYAKAGINCVLQL